jgi:hypothetical protein
LGRCETETSSGPTLVVHVARLIMIPDWRDLPPDPDAQVFLG